MEELTAENAKSFGSLGIQGVGLLLTWCVVRDTWQMNLLTHHAPRTKFINPRRPERTNLTYKHWQGELKMSHNVGQTDRIVRILLGVVFIALGLYFGSWWGAIGLIPLVTGLVNWCPLYTLFGISTCPVKTN